MRPTSFLSISTVCAAGLSNATYIIKDSYNKTNFFDGFSFFSGGDPTHGFVAYQTAISSNNSQLAGYSEGGTIYLGVDSTTVKPQGGRQSTRLESKKSWTKGLFVADVKHMPGNACGIWPAFWTFGETPTHPWPQMGEIDILEGVNTQTNNSVTLHTSSGCTISSAGTSPLSNLQGTNCEGTTGCSSHSNNPASFGDAFNAAGGGVYAMEWTSSFIAVYFFPRDSIPADLLDVNGTPDTRAWPAPMARFSGGGCDVEKHFKEHRMVFNTAFCGDWAGTRETWEKDGKCRALAGTCRGYVELHPEAFVEGYWLIHSVRVFEEE
ncbi:hypothetical protein HYALB_00005769 [Hymenoscyphus albidus]|uniref:endo-1,3(4)-beta-glucanase n=1 Tax=Hymenoscyphus albidus TaxID=595503 RepID=A0A9N9LT35_9HELO|nr:hypothetical protein HYALB_00005769 [Hymenoscyphus albidus]